MSAGPVVSDRGYVPSRFAYRRRLTLAVPVGDLVIGATSPIRVQSMTTTDTLDTEATVQQAERLVAAGCELVRITAPTPQDAENIGRIRQRLADRGIRVPIIADIHFNPAAALVAVRHCDKVRVNPGNYADQKRFVQREYSDAEYAAELERIEQRFKPLVLACKERGVAMRIGTNHGSLSDRIMNRYGDTPLGMVQSALEFVRICRDYDYHRLMLSMKSSNPKVMVEAYRLLVARLDALGWNYPLHLGVTEAGGGEDGRVKSAVGIGTLLDDGLGDTIRVSLTEDPVAEIPVARRLVAPYNARPENPNPNTSEDRQGPRTGTQEPLERLDPYAYERRRSEQVDIGPLALGGVQPVRVLERRGGAVVAVEPDETGRETVEHSTSLTAMESVHVDARVPLPAGPLLIEVGGSDARVVVGELLDAVLACELRGRRDLVLALRMSDPGAAIRGYRLLAARLAERAASYPLHLVASAGGERLDALIDSSTHIGSLLCDGIGDSVEIQSALGQGFRRRLAFQVLQAAGARVTKAEFVACPGCGRTLFDLESTTERIQQRTGHLTGVKIAVMGCIVNGPGEMADADFGYVGGAPGRVNLYVGKELVERNVAQEAAEERLEGLIRARGQWRERPA